MAGGELKPRRRLPWQAVLSPSLEMLQTRLDMAPGGRPCLLQGSHQVAPGAGFWGGWLRGGRASGKGL